MILSLYIYGASDVVSQALAQSRSAQYKDTTDTEEGARLPEGFQDTQRAAST